MNNLNNYIDKISDNFKKIQLVTTIQTLDQVDGVIKYHNENNESSHPGIIIDIYGLLQSLFVGIDALYSLTISVTNNKFYINVNQNKTLNELKHIRNDIVGHPTNRRYGSYGVAYSKILMEDFEYNLFKYRTYFFSNKNIKEDETVVDLSILKEEYQKEKNIIIKRLTDFVNNKSQTDFSLIDELLRLFYETNSNNLELVKTRFINHYGNLDEHRFMWRLKLVKKGIEWQELDKENAELVFYLTKVQIIKMIEIEAEMEKRYIKTPYVKLPYLIKKTYHYLDRNPDLIEYLANLHDNNNPYHAIDLDYLLNNVKENSFLKVLELIKEENDNDKVYMIGSVLKKYRKK
ncbi:MAG: hypothetical protein RBQ97_02570 [Acholeplasma sp.]|nr:hypothetical protein [Acholeplasma sp.]